MIDKDLLFGPLVEKASRRKINDDEPILTQQLATHLLSAIEKKNTGGEPVNRC